MNHKIRTYISWGTRIIAAIILLQTLFFKFSASEESVYIFTKTGMEPWGRIGTGIFELIASVLLLIPATCWIGAFMAAGLMCGAIFFHLTILGIEVMGDGGLLFFYGIIVLTCSVAVIIIHRESVIEKIRKFRTR